MMWKACILLIVCLNLNLQAQEVVIDTVPFYRPDWSIKFVPAALVSTTPAIQFAVERRTFTDQAIQLELGYIKNYPDLPTTLDGFKLRGEYRFYNLLNKKDAYHKAVKPNFFYGVHYLYKQFDATGKAFIFREQLGYQERVDVTVAHKSHAIYAVAGDIFHFKNRFFMEFVFGLGIRSTSIYVRDFAEDASLVSDISTNTFIDLTDGRDELGFLDMLLSFKVGYVIQR